MKTRYYVPSRLAISLIDMNGNLGRIDGGVGFSTQKPCLNFTVEKSEKIIISCDNHFSDELENELKNKMVMLSEQYGLGGVEVVIEDAIPEHRGFGSKTATLLSLGYAYSNLYNKNISFEELSLFFGRGGTSGLGVNLINIGGLVLDGGHSTEHKTVFAPSSATNPVKIPPILARHIMPEFPILIVIPKLQKIFGDAEKAFFASTCPIPENDVSILSRVILMKLLPAVVEHDIAAIASAINLIQDLPWKSSEIGIYGNEVRNIMRRGIEAGALGAGMSSIGPVIYFFGGNLMNSRDVLIKEFFFTEPEEIFFTIPSNSGIRSEIVP